MGSFNACGMYGSTALAFSFCVLICLLNALRCGIPLPLLYGSSRRQRRREGGRGGGRGGGGTVTAAIEH